MRSNVETVYLGVFVTLCSVILSYCPVIASEVDETIFEEGAQYRQEDYVRTRDILVRRGETLLLLLKHKTQSEDWKQRLFAKILISRINEPQMVETWHKNLMSLIEGQDVVKTARTYGEMDWDKLPKKAADVSPFYLVDVLWDYETFGSRGNREVTAAALQFYLAPNMQVLDAILEVAPSDPALRRLAKRAIVKLGEPAVPPMRNVLTKTVTMEPSVPWDKAHRTPEQAEAWSNYSPQMSRACLAAYVLSRLKDRESIPLIAKCLTSRVVYYNYTEELSEALAHMKAVGAINSMLDCTLKSAVNRWYKGINQEPGYSVLRSHVKSLGPQVVPALKIRLKETEVEAEIIILTNLIAEFSGVKGWEKEVAELRESLWFHLTASDILKLHELTGEDVFPKLTELVQGRLNTIDEKIAALLAFGTLKEIRAIPMLTELIRNQHEYLQKKLSERKTSEDSKPFDPHKAREAGYTFGNRETEIAQSMAWGDACLLALRRIGGHEAKRIVVEAAAYPEYETRSNISLLLMENKIHEIAKGLQSDNLAVREEAALALLERKDKRATRELLNAAARRHGPSHNQWKEYTLSSRKNIKPVLHELTNSQNVRENVLGSAMLIEIESPEKPKKCKSLIKEAARHVSMMHVQSISHAEKAGRDLPGKLDESYVPLIEAECVFGQGVAYRAVAAFALAEFKKPGSIYALAESFNMGSFRGQQNPAALALADFGEKGAELAAKVPAPVPGEHDTGFRMTGHRGAAQVLAENLDIRGVDEILKGLETLEKDKSLDMRDHRMKIYLRAAEKFHDKRLVDPLIRILTTSKHLQYYGGDVIKLLSAYDDKRLIPLFTQYLATLDPKSYPDEKSLTLYRAALTALTRRLGEKIPEYLIDQFNQSGDNKVRAASMLALGQLSNPPYSYFVGNGGWSVDRFKENDDRLKAAEKVRKLAYPVLVEALKDNSADVNYMAAYGLTILADRNESYAYRAVSPLTEWCRTENRCFYAAANYLGSYGDQESGKVLLGLLESQTLIKGYNQIVEAIEKLKPEGAVPILLRKVETIAALKKPWYGARGPQELNALANLGDEGAKALLTIFNSTDNLAVQIQAARLLSQVDVKDSAEPIVELLAKVKKAGTKNTQLIPCVNESRDEAYIRSCRTLLEALLELEPKLAKAQAEIILLDGPKNLRKVAINVLSEAG